MLKRVLLSSLLSTLSCLCLASEPRLVVNFIVSSLRSGDIERYSNNFTSDGAFDRLYNSGVSYPKAEFSFAQTTPPATISTIASGAQPVMHGVVSPRWFEYSTGKQNTLLEDTSHRNIPYGDDKSGYSRGKMIAQSYTQALNVQRPECKTFTVSMDALSAIALGGNENVFWLDEKASAWSTSTAYDKAIPDWVNRYNTRNQVITNGYNQPWKLTKGTSKYKNKRVCQVDLGKANPKNITQIKTVAPIDLSKSVNRLKYTPLGLSSILDFTKVAIANLDLGKDSNVDVVNIHFSTTGLISAAYGAESIEVEDMWYRLDELLTDFMLFTMAQVRKGSVLFTLTSDSGIGSSYDIAGDKSTQYGRINTQQMEVILSGFLSARYGSGSWILGYSDNNIYLNHETIYKKKLSLSEVQNEVASFMMHFQGVAYSLTATALRGGSFATGYGNLMQNSFYPRRSGDVVVALLPGWIESRGAAHRAASGSIYHYDRYVPLLFYSQKMEKRKVSQVADMSAFAPTLSHILGIAPPLFSEGEPLIDIKNRVWKE